MVANLVDVELEFLEFSVTGDVDVRGTMMVDRTVRVGFQVMRCNVRMRVKAGTDPRLVGKLEVGAEQSCVVLQTLRAPPAIAMRFEACRSRDDGVSH